jgi:hypothetical protein
VADPVQCSWLASIHPEDNVLYVTGTLDAVDGAPPCRVVLEFNDPVRIVVVTYAAVVLALEFSAFTQVAKHILVLAIAPLATVYVLSRIVLVVTVTGVDAEDDRFHVARVPLAVARIFLALLVTDVCVILTAPVDDLSQKQRWQRTFHVLHDGLQ